MNHKNTIGKLYFSKDMKTYDTAEIVPIKADMKSASDNASTRSPQDGSSPPSVDPNDFQAVYEPSGGAGTSAATAQSPTAKGNQYAFADEENEEGDVLDPLPLHVPHKFEDHSDPHQERMRRMSREMGAMLGMAAGAYIYHLRVTERQRRCGCLAGAYDDIKKECKEKCGTDAQAHHIVPDYTLRYGTRPEAEKDQKRIPGLPTLGRGPAICLIGQATDAGSEHGLAHEADAEVAKLGSARSSPQGTADIASITNTSVPYADRATNHQCTKEILQAVAAQPGLRSQILGRTTIDPPTPGSTQYTTLQSGTTLTEH